MSTKIDWCDEVWNPTTGCTKGCSYCYAGPFAERMAKNPNSKIAHKYRNGFKPTIHPEALTIPLKWKKPRRVFVDSMGDLFDPEIPFEFIHSVLATVALSCKQHTFMILTKQPGRMMEYFKTLYDVVRPNEPIPNLWLGVSVTSQSEADIYIPFLMRTPAVKRFVSIEPMLGPVKLSVDLHTSLIGLDWVICGGMTGKDAQPLNPDWIRSLRDHCVNRDIPFFFKGWGEWGLNWYNDDNGNKITGSEWMDRMGKKAAGHLLDGREWRDIPA